MFRIISHSQAKHQLRILFQLHTYTYISYSSHLNVKILRVSTQCLPKRCSSKIKRYKTQNGAALTSVCFQKTKKKIYITCLNYTQIYYLIILKKKLIPVQPAQSPSTLHNKNKRHSPTNPTGGHYSRGDRAQKHSTLSPLQYTTNEKRHSPRI